MASNTVELLEEEEDDTSNNNRARVQEERDHVVVTNSSSSSSKLFTSTEMIQGQFSLRAVIAGLSIGSLMCFSNMYFGLQTGWVTMGSLQSTLLGYGSIVALQRVGLKLLVDPSTSSFFKTFGPLENVLLQTTAVATATMPLAGGFVGIIPALKMLPSSDTEGLTLNWWFLILWAFSIAFFGVFFAVPLRKQTILKERLKFPSGTATAEMIRLLHKLPDTRERLYQLALQKKDDTDSISLLSTDPSAEVTHSEPLIEENDWDTTWKIFFWAFGVSSFYTLLSYFVPVLQNLPVFSWFGIPSATNFSWVLTPSLSYVGQGMIMGTKTGISMLAGAILGWAILAPLAKEKGWAPGPVNSWQDGAKGWILWISLSIMLTEALVSLAVLLFKMFWKYYKRIPADNVIDPAPEDEQVPRKWWLTGLLVSTLLCVVIVSPLFHMPVYEPLIAVVFALLVSVLAVRALGETDLNPVSGVGKVSQIVFAIVAPGKIVSNLIAGGIAEAGAQQAGDMMQDLKTGDLLGASPRIQFFGQLIGSLVSVFVSVAAYELYTHAYEVPGDKFQVPTAGVWIDMAKLVNGGTLAHNVMGFCIAGAILSGAIPIIESLFPSSKKIKYLPSGIAAAIAMYVTPNWTIARVIGSLANYIWLRSNPRTHKRYMIVIASGFVLGEGVMSIVTAIIKTAGFSVWSCGGCVSGFCPGC